MCEHTVHLHSHDSLLACLCSLVQISQLNSLISMLLGELSSGDRQKIMTICTVDVHARDVVASLIAQKVNITESHHNHRNVTFNLYLLHLMSIVYYI